MKILSKSLFKKSIPIVVVSCLLLLVFWQSFLNKDMVTSFITLILVLFSVFLTIQGLITLYWMLYAWDNRKTLKSQKKTAKFAEPKYSFTAIVPVRSEEDVVADTINSIDKINYPDHLKEIIVVVRHDDKATINKAQEVVASLGNNNHAVLVLVDSLPINKPVSLNQALIEARNQIVTIFDAEDEPSADIYNIVNTAFVTENVDVVQAGVTLMNYNSSWYSALNVMEYYFWFKSGLYLINRLGVSLLGGNTVFIKKKLLKVIGGWDEGCLTEDADIGIRLSAANAKTKVIFYDSHTTREETPPTIEGFIKQRTRWNQGFLQILAKGEWKKLPTFFQRCIAVYLLLAPFLPILLFLYIPFGIWISLYFALPVYLTMITFIPFYLLFAIILNQIVGLYEFTRSYGFKFHWFLPFKILISYFPYMGILTFSASRAFLRFIGSNNKWEKTAHLNVHRNLKLAS